MAFDCFLLRYPHVSNSLKIPVLAYHAVIYSPFLVEHDTCCGKTKSKGLYRSAVAVTSSSSLTHAFLVFRRLL